ncbi:hypothetical protein AAF712_012467 [Marasmius tenuissimus]|uniref:Uncharacterized protein n=1 Tax=Marasmius tenuissimus TaxID=585030 RepID=A0ABR2ZID8_9AGAR
MPDIGAQPASNTWEYLTNAENMCSFSLGFMDLSKPDRVITTIRRPHADLVTSDLPGQSIQHETRYQSNPLYPVLVPLALFFIVLKLQFQSADCLTDQVSLCLDTLVDTVLHVVALPMINGWKPRQYFDRIIHASDRIREVDVVAGQADEGVAAPLRRHVIAIDSQSSKEEDWTHAKPALRITPSHLGDIAQSITV